MFREFWANRNDARLDAMHGCAILCTNREDGMNGPKREGEYPDRDIDLQEHLAGKLVEALDMAEAAGWGRIEAATAMVEAAIAIQQGETGTAPDE